MFGFGYGQNITDRCLAANKRLIDKLEESILMIEERDKDIETLEKLVKELINES